MEVLNKILKIILFNVGSQENISSWMGMGKILFLILEVSVTFVGQFSQKLSTNDFIITLTYSPKCLDH